MRATTDARLRDVRRVGRTRALFGVRCLVLVLLVACTPVRLVAPYDQVMDRETSELNAKLVTFITKMESAAGKPEGTYDANTGFYDEVRGTLATLELRAAAEEKNQQTVAELKELADNVNRLRLLHQMGEERGLNKALADPALQAIEINYGAILKLELAKRRDATSSTR